MPRSDVTVFFSTSAPAFAYPAGADAVATANAVSASNPTSNPATANISGAGITGGSGSVTDLSVTPILDTVTLGSSSNLPSSPGSNNSGIAYDADLDEYQVTIQSGGACDRYSLSGGAWTHEGNVSASTSSSDTEGITWISGTRYAQSSESGSDDHIFIMNNSGSPLTATNEQEHTPGIEGGGSNDGLEGITYASEAELAQAGLAAGLHGNGAFFGVVEARRCFRFECPPFDGQDYHWNYPTSGDALATVTEITGPGGQNLSTYLLSVNCDDMAGVQFDPRNGDGRLLVVCERSGRILFEFILTGDNNTELTYSAELDLTNVQWEGICSNTDGDFIIVEEGGNAAVITYTGSAISGSAPVIEQPSHDTAQGIASTLTKTFTLTSGGQVVWYIKKGPPSATIDPVTGEMTWTPSDDLPRGQGVSFRIGAYNAYGHATPVSFIVHVNNTGETGSLKTIGVDTVSTFMGPAAEEINSGDTLLVTGTNRNISESSTNDYANAFVRDATTGPQYIVPGGSSTQLTTICAEDPFLSISGAPHGSVTGYSNYAMDMSGGQNSWVKFMDFTYREPGRQVARISTGNVFLEGMGFYDGGYEVDPPPTTNAQAAAGNASIATCLINSTGNLLDMVHVGGHGRYLIQFGGDENLRRWCVARPDEHHGDQPRGGMVSYGRVGCRGYNCVVIDGDQEDFTSFYKNHAGGYALPATNLESVPNDQIFERNGMVNTGQPPFGLMDADSGASHLATWFDSWSYDTVNQRTPQTGSTGAGILQSSSQDCTVVRASIGRATNFQGLSRSFISKAGAVSFTDSIIHQAGWTGTATESIGSLLSGSGGSGTFSGAVYDFKGSTTASGWNVTISYLTDSHTLGWEYLPRIESGSTFDTAGIGANAVFLKGKPYHKKTDPDASTNTTIPAWPHPMEDVFRQHNKNYLKLGLTKRLDVYAGATGDLSGDRGFCVDNETFTEYIWGYLGFMLPPLRITHKVTGSVVTFYNAPLESFREDNRTGWRVYKTTDLVTPVASVNSRAISVNVSGLTSGDYIMTNTFSTYTPSFWMNGDESGQSIQTLAVVV